MSTIVWDLTSPKSEYDNGHNKVTISTYSPVAFLNLGIESKHGDGTSEYNMITLLASEAIQVRDKLLEIYPLEDEQPVDADDQSNEDEEVDNRLHIEVDHETSTTYFDFPDGTEVTVCEAPVSVTITSAEGYQLVLGSE